VRPILAVTAVSMLVPTSCGRSLVSGLGIACTRGGPDIAVFDHGVDVAGARSPEAALEALVHSWGGLPAWPSGWTFDGKVTYYHLSGHRIDAIVTMTYDDGWIVDQVTNCVG